uniref:Intraflagellar transport protein 81 n=1 Tax=Lygus hesperus TaxID=30085 RepID=A0A0A9W612_LYGHE
MLGDPEIGTAYEQYEQLIDEFKTTHKELAALQARGMSAQELRTDIDAMENEKQIVNKKIERASRKLEVVENKESYLEAARGLRLERERQKELASQRANEVDLLQELQQTSARLTQQLSELRAASKGTTPEGLVRSLEEEVKMHEYIATEKLPKEIEAKRKEVEILSRVANAPPPSQETLDHLRRQIERVSQEVSELAQRGLAAKEGAEDNLAPYRQQAQIMARRKEEMADEFAQVKARLDAMHQELQAREGSNTSERPLSEKEYKEYLSKLKVRSTLYKAKKAQISALVAEAGVLARTIDVLNQYQEAIPSVDTFEVLTDSDLDTIPKDEMMQRINIINNQITAHKASMTPKLQELRACREKYNEVLEEYTDRKRTYDSKAATLEASIAKLEQEVKEMMKEEEANQSQTAIYEAKTDIIKTILSRAEEEAKNTGDKPSFKTLLEAKISESEKLNGLLRQEQQEVRVETERKTLQRSLWINLEALLKCKEQCIESEKQNAGILKRAKGTETLVLQ